MQDTVLFNGGRLYNYEKRHCFRVWLRTQDKKDKCVTYGKSPTDEHLNKNDGRTPCSSSKMTLEQSMSTERFVTSCFLPSCSRVARASYSKLLHTSVFRVDT